MELKREALPSHFIPLFMIWVALCNIGVIALSVVLYLRDIAFTGLVDLSSAVDLGIILGINILSLILLFPLFKMNPIKPFFLPAIIWFVLISVIYAVFGMYLLLIFGGVQLGADIWFELMYRALQKKQQG